MSFFTLLIQSVGLARKRPCFFSIQVISFPNSSVRPVAVCRRSKANRWLRTGKGGDVVMLLGGRDDSAERRWGCGDGETRRGGGWKGVKDVKLSLLVRNKSFSENLAPTKIYVLQLTKIGRAHV